MSTCIRFKMADGCHDLAPQKAHADDAAYDLRSREELTIAGGDFKLVKTGLFLELPFGWEAQVRPRSGLACKSGITVLNSPGTIDAGYRGEVGVILHNVSRQEFSIKRGDRIAQLVLQKLSEAELVMVEEICESTLRGEGGFGSTGHR